MMKGIPKEHPKPKCPQYEFKNLMEVQTLKTTLKETKQHICTVELQGLPSLIGKKNDEKLDKLLK
jgi:hypothetical protein